MTASRQFESKLGLELIGNFDIRLDVSLADTSQG
jgi:hypothetical protein